MSDIVKVLIFVKVLITWLVITFDIITDWLAWTEFEQLNFEYQHDYNYHKYLNTLFLTGCILGTIIWLMQFLCATFMLRMFCKADDVDKKKAAMLDGLLDYLALAEELCEDLLISLATILGWYTGNCEAALVLSWKTIVSRVGSMVASSWAIIRSLLHCIKDRSVCQSIATTLIVLVSIATLLMDAAVVHALFSNNYSLMKTLAGASGHRFEEHNELKLNIDSDFKCPVDPKTLIHYSEIMEERRQLVILVAYIDTTKHNTASIDSSCKMVTRIVPLVYASQAKKNPDKPLLVKQPCSYFDDKFDDVCKCLVHFVFEYSSKHSAIFYNVYMVTDTGQFPYNITDSDIKLNYVKLSAGVDSTKWIPMKQPNEEPQYFCGTENPYLKESLTLSITTENTTSICRTCLETHPKGLPKNVKFWEFNQDKSGCDKTEPIRKCFNYETGIICKSDIITSLATSLHVMVNRSWPTLLAFTVILLMETV